MARKVVDALNVTLTEKEVDMLDSLLYDYASPFFKMKRSEAIRSMIKINYNALYDDVEEGSK